MWSPQWGPFNRVPSTEFREQGPLKGVLSTGPLNGVPSMGINEWGPLQFPITGFL